MSNPYIGEIRIFAGNFAPVGWAFCDGQVMPISENDALFNLIGTTYGGDGQETFALPNLQSRLPMHQGSGHVIGEAAGVESVTLTSQQTPIHSHVLFASVDAAVTPDATGKVLGQPTQVKMYSEDGVSPFLSPSSVTQVGGSQPHDNLQPYLCVHFIISLYGIYPTQS